MRQLRKAKYTTIHPFRGPLRPIDRRRTNDATDESLLAPSDRTRSARQIARVGFRCHLAWEAESLNEWRFTSRRHAPLGLDRAHHTSADHPGTSTYQVGEWAAAVVAGGLLLLTGRKTRQGRRVSLRPSCGMLPPVHGHGNPPLTKGRHVELF